MGNLMAHLLIVVLPDPILASISDGAVKVMEGRGREGHIFMHVVKA